MVSKEITNSAQVLTDETFEALMGWVAIQTGFCGC